MDEDHKAIEAIIGRQFGSLNWTPHKPADWSAFVADFLPGASLYPAARPAKRQTPEEFVARMKGLAESKLLSFKEDVLGRQIQVFGNVAIVAAGCQFTENGKDVNRGVEMMLLIKEDGKWRIAAQGWDTENELSKLSADLLSK
jgi:ketosteroid isomerase-like protein